LQSKTKFIILSFASQNKVLLRKTFFAKPYIAKGDVKIDALPLRGNRLPLRGNAFKAKL